MEEVHLTPREHEILLRLCEGWSNQAIANHFVLSLDTVKWFNKQIFSKLGVANRVQATLAARTLGLSVSQPLSQAVSHLPAPLTSFIGRAETISQLCDLLDDHRLVTIVGPGGIGKTRIALEVAYRFRDGSRFKPYFVSLAAYSDPAEVPLAVAECLSITIARSRSVLDQLVAVLQEQAALLVLDNFEQVAHAVDFVVALLRGTHRVRILVTSRERLNGYGEAVFTLEGLTVPNTPSGTEIPESEAGTLFIARARLTNANYQPLPSHLEDIAAICRLLGGMPLAIEHAAGWINVLDPAAILAEIRRSLDFLRTSKAGIESRHQRMRAVIDSAWNRLSESDRIALMKFSVFRGGFERDAAAAVAGVDLDLLSSLVAKSFVMRSSPERYDVHELNRQYAYEKLVERGETVAVRQQHAHFFRDLVHRLCPPLASVSEDHHVAALRRLDKEYPNLREAIQWSLREEDGCTALSILGEGALMFNERIYSPETRVWLRQALQKCHDRTPRLRAQAYRALTQIDHTASDAERHEFLVWARRTEDIDLMAWALGSLGTYALDGQQYDTAKAYYEQAIALYTESGYDSPTCGIALNSLGLAIERLGDTDQALSYHLASWEHSRKHGIRAIMRPIHCARLYVQKGQIRQAQAMFQSALDNANAVGSPWWICRILFYLATFFRDYASVEVAVQLFAVSSVLAKQFSDRMAEVPTLTELLGDNAELPLMQAQWQLGLALTVRDAVGLAQQTLEEMDV